MTFDKISKKRATDCTPEGAREELDVFKTNDPVTKNQLVTAPAGYDASSEDDIHKCSDVKPQVNSIDVSGSGTSYTISVNIASGTHTLETYDILVDGKSVKSGSGGGTQTVKVSVGKGQHTVTVNLRDSAYYTASDSRSFVATAPSEDSSDDN